MGLIGFKNNLSNKYLKGHKHKSKLRMQQIRRNRHLSRLDFLEDFGSFPASFRTMEQKIMKVQGFSRNVGDSTWCILADSSKLSNSETTMKLSVDLANRKADYYGMNGNSSVVRTIQTKSLETDMIYVFVLDATQCNCGRDCKKCMCQLKVDQK